MEGGIRLTFLALLLMTTTMVEMNEIVDYKAWLGEEPLTPERILDEMVEYFSRRDPHGIPVLDMPDVIHIPGPVKLSQITFSNLDISGHRGLRIEYINVNLTSLSANVRISIEMVKFNGDYSWPGFFSTSKGFSNITVSRPDLSLDLSFTISEEGKLRCDPKMGLEYEYINQHFSVLSTLQETLVSAAGFFFSYVIQPFLFSHFQPKIQTVINEQLQQRLENYTFPDSISPVDFAVAMIRMDLRRNNKDPLKFPDQDVHLTWGVTAHLQNIELGGITTLHRTHEISAQLIDNVYVTVQLGTQALKGSMDWSLSTSLLPALGGHMSLEVESLKVTVEILQPANIRSPPTLRKIDVKLGNIAVRSEGEGTFDYLVEAFMNILPNFFRNQIMDKVEVLLHQKVQKFFNKLDLYRIILNKVKGIQRTAQQ